MKRLSIWGFRGTAWGLSACLVACSGTETGAGCEEEGNICTFLGNGEAGLGEDGAAPLEVSLYLPQDLTFGPDGKPYVLDWNNHRVRTVDDDRVETVIGTGYLGDAPNGAAQESPLNHPTHITFDDRGDILLSAWHNSKILRYDFREKTVTAICGDGKRDYAGDGGPAELAVLDLPAATAIDRQGRLVIMDQANQRLRRIENDGTIDTIVGPSSDFLPVPESYERVCVENAEGIETCKLCSPADAEDPACPGKKPQGFAGDGGPGTEAVMFQPFSQSAPPAGRIDMGHDGTLYFCDTGNHRIRALDEDGTVRTVAGSGPDEFDREYKGGYSGDGGKATRAKLKTPSDVAAAPSGNLYIADTMNDCIRKVDEEGIISTVAGVCGERGFGGDEGPATEALLNRPYGIAFSAEGDLYIADSHNHRIRVVRGVEPASD